MAHTESQFVVLLLVAALVGMFAQRLRLPYTVALVLAGIGLGFLNLPQLAALRLTPELLMLVFLPALLFEAAYHLDLAELRRELLPVLLLAVVGVLLAVGVTGVATYYGLSWLGVGELGLGLCFLFGAMIAATDPISVLALFRTLGVNRRLYLLVEGESLLNDGVAVVVFLIVAAVLGIESAHGAAPQFASTGAVLVYGLRTFAWMGLGGALIGAALGGAASWVTRQVDDKLVETALTVVVAYGSFLLAEHFHASGVLATVAAGVVLGSFGSHFGMSARTRVAVMDFWEFLAFFSNTFVFLLVGVALDVTALAATAGAIAVAFGAVILGRATSVYGLLPWIQRFGREPVPRAWAHVLVWGGLRGSLSMVLAIGLPPSLPGRQLLLELVFGVVSVSLLLQALTMRPLLARLGLIQAAETRTAYETARARVLMAQAALGALERQRDHLEPALCDRLVQRYTEQLESARAEARAAAGERFDQERFDDALLHCLAVEAEALRHAQAEGVVGADVAEALQASLAAARERVVHGGAEPPPG